MDERLKHALIVLVAAVWAANFTATLLMSDYTSDASIHAVFMATVGGLITLGKPKSDPKSDADSKDRAP